VSNSQTPGSPPLFWWISGLSWVAPGAPGKTPESRAVKNGRTPPKYFARAVDNASSCRYNQDAGEAAARKRKENVHFLILLIPIKILLLVLILQYIFGG
tara:strand:- start:225 stop:521 length:297 start_codon:yes stop_codon:yes gene_type:complete